MQAPEVEQVRASQDSLEGELLAQVEDSPAEKLAQVEDSPAEELAQVEDSLEGSSIDTKARSMILHQTKHSPVPPRQRTVPHNSQGTDIHFRLRWSPMIFARPAIATWKGLQADAYCPQRENHTPPCLGWKQQVKKVLP